MAKKELKTGDSVTITDRLYLILDASGRIRKNLLNNRPLVLSTREEARGWCNPKDRVVRLNDIVGTVVR